jgi:plastocyanin
MRRSFGVLVLAAFVATGACGGSSSVSNSTGPTGGTTTGGGGGSAPVATTSVTVSDDQFTPPNIQVSPGATVTWTWSANAGQHNVTFSDVASTTLSAGGFFTRTFGTAGTFSYLCTLHPSVMTGSVLVK